MWMVITCSYVNDDNLQLCERHRKVTVLSQSCSVLPCNMLMALQCDLLGLWNKQVPERGTAVAHNWRNSLRPRWHAENKKQNSLVVDKQVRNNRTQTTRNTKACHSQGKKSCIWLKENDLLPNMLLANKQNWSNSLPWRSCWIISWCFDYKTEKMRQTFANARVGCKRTPCL